jgi:hypothetical protein
MSNEQITHDRLQYEAFTWAHNNIVQVRGRLFAVLNEIKPISWTIQIPGKPPRVIMEPKANHLKRISQAKAIGLQSGALDLLFMAPERTGAITGYHVPATNYGFDAKIGSDKIHDKQLDFVDILVQDGGNGYPFYSLAEFQSIFIPIIRKHYGPII